MAGPGRYRRRERTQAEERLTFSQKTWQGQNSDDPATELNQGELAHAENVEFRGKYLVPRSGSKLFSATFLPGTGAYRSVFFHRTTKKWLVHRGTEVYVSTDANAYLWRQLIQPDTTTPDIPDTDSTIQEFDDDAIIFTTAGIYHLDLTNIIAFRINHDAPFNKLADVGSAGADYEYNYLITWCRLVDSDGVDAGSRDRFDPDVRLVSESGTTRIYSIHSRDYSKFRSSSPINAANTTAYSLSASATVTAITASTDVVVPNDDNFSESLNTGSRVDFTGTLPPPLQSGVDYYVIRYGGTVSQIKLAYTLEDALKGNAIDILSDGSGQTIRAHPNFGLPSTGVTHYGIYRTLNVSGNTDDGFDPVTSEGNNPQLFGWVADVQIGTGSFTDKIPDDSLRAQIAAGSRLAKMRGFTPLPNGGLGRVVGGWLFTASTDSNELRYTSISESQKRFAGHYFSDLQNYKFDQKIKALTTAADDLLVLTATQTKPVTITSFYNAGNLEFVPVLNHFPKGDETIGITDKSALAEFEGGTVAAKTSDYAVRIWDGTRWGDDISANAVNDIVKKMASGVVLAYSTGSLYLWYRDDSTALFNNKCLRFDTGRSRGRGWSQVTGSFPFPPLAGGAVLIQDSKDLPRLIVLDFDTSRLFWIHTFESQTGIGITNVSGDKITDEGICTLGLKYFYDEMDNNSKAAELLNVLSTPVGSDWQFATEQNGRMELAGDGDGNGELAARIILDKYIHNGDFQATVRQTYQDFGADAFPRGTLEYEWEVKVADFRNVNFVDPHYTSDQSNIDDLDNGFLAYIRRTAGRDNENASTLNWRYKSGSTEESGSIGWTEISAPSLDAPYKLGIKRESNTINVVINDVEIPPARSTNSVWGSVTNLRASFAQEQNTGDDTGESGFNSFFVAGGDMPNDCLGTDGLGSDTVSSDLRIASVIRFAEIIGREESHVVRHEESHTYFRPKSESDGFHSGFEVDWVSYSDGSTTATETVTDVAYSGDVQNWKKVEGRRIQNELQTNMGLWKLVGVDTHYASQDKKSIDNGPDATDEATYQELIAGTSSDVNYLTHWLTRPDTDLNRATGDSYGLDLTQVSSPDGNAYGVSLISLDQATDTRQYTDFSMLFWVKGASGGYVEIDGGVDLRIQFLNTTTIRISGGGVTTTDVTVDDMVSDWSSLLFKKTGETLTIYQNGSTTAKGSVTVGASYGNETIDFFGSEVAWSMFDFRLYRADIITPEAFEYYHNDIVNNSGSKTLPLV